MGERCDEAVHNPATPPGVVALTGSLGTHDPMVIAAGGRYYMFHTGNGVSTKTSTNLTSWTNGGRALPSNPPWIAQMVPAATNLWAPDVANFGGTYHLYYSASSFSENRSCIGHATKAALDSTAAWTDRGPTICSNTGNTNDDWNAIDPNVAFDEAGTPWLSFGSFWSGIKMVKLTTAGDRADTTLHSLANRPAVRGALEAPFIVRRCGYYYLFVSFDTCCQGVSSTYKIAVGRSTSITGPYADKAGTAMMSGGGTIIVQGDTRWRGPGHNAVLFANQRAYNIYHSYDANANGSATLRISDLVWDAQGWPISGGP
jgi:arabinan endo-1,5-alpha-L-arabinosidase